MGAVRQVFVSLLAAVLAGHVQSREGCARRGESTTEFSKMYVSESEPIVRAAAGIPGWESGLSELSQDDRNHWTLLAQREGSGTIGKRFPHGTWVMRSGYGSGCWRAVWPLGRYL